LIFRGAQWTHKKYSYSVTCIDGAHVSSMWAPIFVQVLLVYDANCDT
jgi:hypothetical protein